MLANLRFVIGAALATALLAVTALGLFAAEVLPKVKAIKPVPFAEPVRRAERAA